MPILSSELDRLVGLTAGEAHAVLVTPPRRGVLRWLRQSLCAHVGAFSERLPGFSPATYHRHCGRCGKSWCWTEGR